MEAHNIGSAAFLAPETRTSPESGTPPWITSLSTTVRRLLLSPLFGRECTHRQGVNFLAHTFAKRAIDDLVLLDTILVAKLGADDDGLEVLTVTDDFDVFTDEIFQNVRLYGLGS